MIGFEARQVFDIEVAVHITEYQAEILADQNGTQFIAEFPIRSNAKSLSMAAFCESTFSLHVLIPISPIGERRRTFL